MISNNDKKIDYVEGAIKPDKMPTVEELEKELKKKEEEKLKKVFKDKK